MKNLAVYDRVTGKIKYVLNCRENDTVSLPDDEGSVEVTDSTVAKNSYVQNSALINKGACPSAHHEFDYSSKQWVDPRSLNDLKDAKWIEIKQARDEAEFGGFTWNGSMFDSTSISQSRIQGASQLATLAVMNAQPFSIDWTLADNSIRTLSAQDMLAIGQALGVHINTQHGKARQKRVEINTAKSLEEVVAITW